MDPETEEEIEIKVEDNAKSMDSDIKPSTSGRVLFPSETKFNHIKNKQVRSQQYQKAKKQSKKVNTQHR